MAETARENQVNSAAVKYETVADMGSGLVIAKVKLTDFREQDINARIMKTEMQKQLTDNIKKRGQLESLPFCALIDGKIEIISGHHRIRSAKDSGVLTELFVILDTTGLRRSQVAARKSRFSSEKTPTSPPNPTPGKPRCTWQRRRASRN